MTDLALPGEIPGLLRRGSPVTHVDGSCMVVVELDGNDAKLPSGWAFTRLLTLDLSDATGRAHAVWWLVGSSDPDDVGEFLVRNGLDVLRFCLVGEKAATGDDLSDEDILLLRRVILYVAGIDDNG